MIVADTHAWVWWAADRSRLSVRARKAMETAPTIGVSAMSCWEVALLVARGRLELDRDVLTWLRQALALDRVQLLPLSPEIAIDAATLESPFPGDPADRIIVASAMRSRAKIVTKDDRIRSWDRERTIW